MKAAMERSGVVVVDKPRGPTSHDVVARARKRLGTRAIGHAGTLDPMATGVLVLAIGEGTKLVPYLTAHDKSYRATVRFGAATRSLDAEGEVVESRAVDGALIEALAAIERGERSDTIESAIAIERARTAQIPPLVSAIKIDGVASHARVRRGDEVTLEARQVEVRAIDVVGASAELHELEVTLDVAKGYYVRAFARDLAASLGTVAHLTALRRTKSGPFTVEEAVPLARIDERIIPLRAAAERTLPIAALAPEGAIKARQGKKLDDADFVGTIGEGVAAWVDPEGALVAIGERTGEIARVLRGFRS